MATDSSNSDLLTGANKALVKNVYLEAGKFFDIRRHYFTTVSEKTLTKDEFVDINDYENASSEYIGENKAQDPNHGNASHWQVQEDKTGYYDIYINGDGYLYVGPTAGSSTAVNPAPAPLKEKSPVGGAKKKNAGPIKKNATVSGNPSSNVFLVFNVSGYTSWNPTPYDWYLEYWSSNGDHNSNSTWVSLGTSYYAAVSSSATGGIIQFKQDGKAKHGYFDFPSGLTAGNFYEITLSGVSGNWYHRDGSGDNWNDGFNVQSISKSSLSPTQLTVYCDTSWLTTWSGTVTNPQLAVFNNSGNTLLSLPGGGSSMSGSVGEICSYSFSYYGGKPQAQFRCDENSTTKYSTDLTLPTVSSGDKLYVTLLKTWTNDNPKKMNATIAKQSAAVGNNYTIYLFDPLGYKNSATFYCYAWKSNASVNPYYNAAWPGTAFSTTATDNLYSVTFSQSYDKLIISDGANQCSAVNVSSAQGKYFVLNYVTDYEDGTSNRFDNASWYSSISTVATGSGNETTYYVYDRNNTLGSNPKAYAWTENDHEDFSGTYYYPYQKWEWDSAGDTSATGTTGLRSISIPNQYDHIIFLSSDGSKQTVDEEIDPDTPYFMLDDTTTDDKYEGRWGAFFSTITFDKNEGTGGDNGTSALYGQPMDDVSVIPTKSGYRFEGYYDSTFTTQYYDGSGAAQRNWDQEGSAVTLYAKWDNTTLVTLNNQGATTAGAASVTATYGSSMPSIAANLPAKTGYTFGGYYASAGGSGTKYYNSDGTSATNWDQLDATKTLYAQWTAITYSVKFNANGGSGSMGNESFTYGVAKTLTSNSFTRTGYTFAGWATSSDGSVVYANGQSVSNLANTQGAVFNLYAKWTANTYYVSFNKNGGSGSTMSNQTFTYGTAQNLTANSYTAPTGYSFDGWNTNEHGTGTSYTNQQSVSNLVTTHGTTVPLYAMWKIATITLERDGAGGTGTPSISNQIYNKALPNITAPTRTGYTFDGYWTTTDNSGAQIYNANGTPAVTYWTQVGVSTLHAHWTAENYYITFDYTTNGGTVAGPASGSTRATYGSAAPAIATDKITPYKVGWGFLGFYSTASGEGTQYYDCELNPTEEIWSIDGGANNSSVTLYARYVELSTTNSYYVNSDGLGTSNTLYAYFWGDGYRYFVPLSTADGYSNVYSVAVPDDASGMLFYRGSSGIINGSCQTLNLTLSEDANEKAALASDLDDSYGADRGSRNMINITTDTQTEDAKAKHKWDWVTYGARPTATGYGYYLVPTDTGSWANGTKMQHVGTPGGSAYLQAYQASAGINFEIWRFGNDNSWVIVRKDAAGDSIVDVSSGKLNIATAGTYDIYVVYSSSDDSLTGVYCTNTYSATLNFSILNGVSSSESYVMGIGNLSGIGVGSESSWQNNANNFMLDASVNVKAGDTFTISFTNGASANDKDYPTDTGYPAIDSGSSSILHVDTTNHVYVFDAAGRYTIYWTTGGKLAVAAVPTYGNGYYIMPYSSSTDGYASGIKMATNPNIDGGFFTGFYIASDNTQYYVRSYLDAVDLLYSGSSMIHVDSNIEDKVQFSGAVITMDAGRYNIHVKDGVVYISAYTTEDHFSLDPLVSGLTVENNYTSIVYEIEVTISATGPISFTCQAEGLTNSTYIGWKFYAPLAQITEYDDEENEAAAYLEMRDRYFGSDDQIDSEIFTTPGTYYLYIIIDYKTGQSAIPMTMADEIDFVITAVQESVSLVAKVDLARGSRQ